MLKAYSVYDEEINYCQGVSFLAASLLLHVSHMIDLLIDQLIYSLLVIDFWLNSWTTHLSNDLQYFLLFFHL